MSSKSKKAILYALQALRLYREAKGEVLTNFQVAQQLDIAIPYAVKVNRLLKGAGLIRSVRGNEGGYILAKDLSGVSIADTVLGIDKSIGRILEANAGDTEDMLLLRQRLRETLLSSGWGQSIASLL